MRAALVCVLVFFFVQAEDGIRDLVRSRGLGDVYKRQLHGFLERSAFPAESLFGFAGVHDEGLVPFVEHFHLSLIHI